MLSTPSPSFGNFRVPQGVVLHRLVWSMGMRHRIATTALATAMIALMSAAAPAETVDGVTVLRGGPSAVQHGPTTVLRGAPVTPGSSEAAIGSGSSAPPGNTGAVMDRSGAANALHTGSANAGGEFDNLPPGAGR